VTGMRRQTEADAVSSGRELELGGRGGGSWHHFNDSNNGTSLDTDRLVTKEIFHGLSRDPTRFSAVAMWIDGRGRQQLSLGSRRTPDPGRSIRSMSLERGIRNYIIFCEQKVGSANR
jgi:hypothetical protein